jgi:hypothetical protein
VDPDFPELKVSHFILQSEINHLVRGLNLPEIQTELLVSHLQGWNLLQQDVKVSHRKHQQSLSQFLPKDGELVYCNDVEGLLQELGCEQKPDEWRLFLDSPKFSLKAVLRNGNIQQSILIA